MSTLIHLKADKVSKDINELWNELLKEENVSKFGVNMTLLGYVRNFSGILVFHDAEKNPSDENY
jgi:hypothetical protein